MKWTSTYAAHSYLSDDIAPPLQLTDCVTVPAFAPTLSTPQPFGYYAVTRINPLFVEDKSLSNDDSNSRSINTNTNSNTNHRDIRKTEIICGETGGNYTYGPIAIGIDRDNHHIDIDIDDDDHPDTDTIDYHPHEYSLRDDAFAVLKQNYDFIRSVLVSVRVNKRHCHNTHQHHRSASRSAGSKITSSSQFHPAEISNQNPDRRKTASRATNLQSLRKNECWFASSPSQRLNEVGDVTLNTGRNSNHRRNLHQRDSFDKFRHNDRVAIAYGNQKLSQDLSSRQIPRDVAINGDQGTETCISPVTNSPLEIVLRCLRDKIDECLRNSDSPTTWPSSTDDPAIATLYRAYRLISAYHRKCRHNSSRVVQNNPTLDEDLLEKCQVDLLQCLGRVSYYADQCESSSYSSSSASAASTSGFSDLTPTPPFTDASTSASDSPTPVPASALVSINQAATNPDKFNYSRIVRFAKRPNNPFKIKHAVCSRAPQQRHVTFGAFRATPSSAGKDGFDRFPHHFEQCRGIDIVHDDDKSLQKPASQLRSSSYPGHRCPDFTLDVQQAEKVVEKIKNRKKERCWCQIITCIVGFAFLVFSVMSFSMVLSRGEKLFGPL